MRSRAPLLFVLAALLYAAIMIAWTYPLLFKSTTHAALDVGLGYNLDFLATTDQLLSISGGARNAAAILEGNLPRLIDNGICYPTPMAATLGEHLIEPGLLGLPAYAISGNPILAYNTAALLSFVIAGLAMLALVRHWTGSWLAGFVAGLLFAFHPSRLEEIGHLHVIGIHWLPLVLLYFDRLLHSGRVIDAALLALFAALQSLVGSYPLMILVGFGIPFGAVRLIQLRAALDQRRLVLLLAAVAAVTGVAAAVLVPYAITADSWQSLHRRGIVQLIDFAALLPGGYRSVGLLGLALAATLLLLGPRARRSAALAVLAGTATCFLLASKGVLWPGGPFLSGLYPWLADHISLLGTVRVPGKIVAGGFLGVSLLAGLGLGFLLQRLHARERAAVGLGLAAVVFALFELFHPAIATAVYHYHPTVTVELRSPPQASIEAYEAFDRHGLPGPILELPYPPPEDTILRMPGYLLMAAYHQRPTAACFNSHMPPTYPHILRIASRLPTERAVQELAAMGLRNLVFEGNALSYQLRAKAERMGLRPGIEVLHREGLVSLRIDSEVETHSDQERLEPVGAYLDETRSIRPLPRRFDIEIENRGDTVWVLPQPLRAHEATVRWWRDGAPGPWSHKRVMLPLALAAGARDRIRVEIPPAPRGCRNCTAELRIDELGWNIQANEPRPGQGRPAVMGPDRT